MGRGAGRFGAPFGGIGRFRSLGGGGHWGAMEEGFGEGPIPKSFGANLGLSAWLGFRQGNRGAGRHPSTASGTPAATVRSPFVGFRDPPSYVRGYWAKFGSKVFKGLSGIKVCGIYMRQSPYNLT